MGRGHYAVLKRREFARVAVILSIFLVSVLVAGIGRPVTTPVYASPNYTLTEWTLPTANSGPYGISLDPSGNCCWFLEFFTNRVAHLDPGTGTVQEWTIPTPNAGPTGIVTTTFSGQMMVWGTEFNTNKVFVFFPSTNTFYEFTLPTANSGPEYLSVEPSGLNVRVWVTEFGTTGTRNANGEFIYNPSTPTSATLYEDSFPAGAGGGANGLYAGPGVVWFAGVTGLVKWDRVSNQYTSWALPTHGSAFGRFLTLDALGQVWYTQGVSAAGGSDNYVGVLRGDNTIKQWQIPTVGADPRLISMNSLTQHPWIAEDSQNAGNGRIAELDPSAGGSVTGYIGPVTTAAGAGPPSGVSSPVIPPVSPSTNVIAPTSNPNVGATTGQFTEWTIGSSTQPHDVVVDSSGNVWLLEAGANKVARLSPTAPDFTISPAPPTISIAQGGSASMTIVGSSQLGFSGPVTLSVTGSVPADVSFSAFSPNPISIPSGGTASATFTVNVAASATPGTSPITISGTGSSGTHETSFALTITPSADFSMSLSSPALTLAAGGSTTETATVTSTGSFSSAVNLGTGSLPAGVHISFSPGSITPPLGGSVTSTMTVTVDPGTLASTSTIPITGTSGSLSHSTSLTLTIAPTVTTTTTGAPPDFSVAAAPSSLAISPGVAGTSSIAVTSINGFSSSVDLTYSWIGTAPTGVSVTLPSPVTPPSGSTATSTLTVDPSGTSSTGSFTLSVTGTSGSLTHSVNVAIAISPKCLIATATYGSELAPEVQLLRSFRDNSIMKTQAGSNFMYAFNAWYYSFSPYVATYLATHSVERGIMKGVLYPLVGILYVSSQLFSVTSSYPELAALLSGLLASSMIGAFYVGLPFGLLRGKVRRLRGVRAQGLLQKIVGFILLGGVAAILIGEASSSAALLMISSATVVLSSLFLSATLVSARIARRLESRF